MRRRKKAMNGLSSALIATSLVLAAVFVPVSFSEWNYRTAVSSVYGDNRGICTDFYCGCFDAESGDVFADSETG